MANTTWRKLIAEECDYYEDNVDELEMTLDPAELDVEFNDGHGLTEGAPFTAWSKDRVYFPLTYLGTECVGSAPRNPCEEACGHQGDE